ncbi:hypothetical protein RI367_000074 [Sorochytrium milnesiophthora]
MIGMLSHLQLPSPGHPTAATRKGIFSQCYEGPAFIRKLTRTDELKSHTGCVNTISWSDDGELLLSSGDDTRVCVWRPGEIGEQQQLPLKFPTGHRANIFSVKFMPQTSDTVVATCSLDGRVKVHDLFYTASRAKTRHTYSCHSESVKRLVTEPDNPHLLFSCSEDSTVRQFDLRESHDCSSSSLACGRPLIDYSRNRVEFNTLTMDAYATQYLAVAGSTSYVYVHDRRFLRTGRNESAAAASAGHARRSRHLTADVDATPRSSCVARLKPTITASDASSSFSRRALNDARGHITAARFNPSQSGEILASYSGDAVYLFDIFRDGALSSAPAAAASATPTRRQRVDKAHDAPSSSHTSSSIATQPPESSPKRARLHQSTTPSKRAKVSSTHQTPTIEANDSDGEQETDATDEPIPHTTATDETESALDTDVWQTTDDGDSSDDTASSDSDDEEEEEEPQEPAFLRALVPDQPRGSCEGLVPVLSHVGGPYRGHANVKTVKDVNFYGPTSSYVVSGSDCGHLFIWNKNTCEVVNVLKGDEMVVNAIAGNPVRPMLACSGIDHTVKIFEPVHPSADLVETPNEWSALNDLDALVEANRRSSESGIRGIAFQRSMIRALFRSARFTSGAGGSGSGSAGGAGASTTEFVFPLLPGDSDEEEGDEEDSGNESVGVGNCGMS